MPFQSIISDIIGIDWRKTNGERTERATYDLNKLKFLSFLDLLQPEHVLHGLLAKLISLIGHCRVGLQGGGGNK